MTRTSSEHARIVLRFCAAFLVGAAITLFALMPAAATSGVAQAATNNGLTIDPGSGSTLAGSPTFNVPAPGCSGTANSASVTIKGPGVTGENADGSKNMIGAKPAPSGSAISIGSGSVSWDGFAVDLSIPRPLNGTYLIKVQCLEDGDETGQPFFDREVAFVGTGSAGTNGTWTAVGQSGGGSPTPTPTPTGSGTPTPTPAGSTPTPQPSSDATPTPEPGADCDPAVEDCTQTEGEDDGSNDGDGSQGLPNTGGRGPGDAMTLAALLLFSGLLFLALTVEGPRPDRYDEDDHR